MTMRNTKITNRWGKFLCAALAAGAVASAALPARADERRGYDRRDVLRVAAGPKVCLSFFPSFLPTRTYACVDLPSGTLPPVTTARAAPALP